MQEQYTRKEPVHVPCRNVERTKIKIFQESQCLEGNFVGTLEPCHVSDTENYTNNVQTSGISNEIRPLYGMKISRKTWQNGGDFQSVDPHR